MKRLLVYVFLFPIICTSQYTAIPDQNFEQVLIDLGYDNVIDGQVLTSNIDTITVLNVEYKNISDLTGIEDFNALTHLSCSGNLLMSLDLSNNTTLTYLQSSPNYSLTSLDVSGCNALTYLNCEGTQLTSLDVSQNIALTKLVCSHSQLTSLDVSQNTVLDSLLCDFNQLTSLDVSGCNALTYLNCRWNPPLTSLDVSQNTALIKLVCSNNPLTSLDVSQNTNLNFLICWNSSLECLNLKNGNDTNFQFLWATDNPYLNCIEVDDPNWATQNWTNHIDDWVTFSTNCNYPAGSGCFISSIEENQSNLSIYPNPTNSLIQIEIENYNGTFEAELYDFTGKLLETTNSTKLRLVDNPKGIYLLKVSYGDIIELVKVVKE